jgi:hypothetical protein
MVLDLSSKFGLTPADRNKLLRDGAMHFDDETLFGRARRAGRPPRRLQRRRAARRAAADDGPAIGSLSIRLGPAGAKPN